jgi:hypothetical protein
MLTNQVTNHQSSSLLTNQVCLRLLVEVVCEGLARGAPDPRRGLSRARRRVPPQTVRASAGSPHIADEPPRRRYSLSACMPNFLQVSHRSAAGEIKPRKESLLERVCCFRLAYAAAGEPAVDAGGEVGHAVRLHGRGGRKPARVVADIPDVRTLMPLV